ncbi:MAG: phage head closure protein [Zhenhengia sp.]|uniref:phage head closure protein n=1 Tax=Zhenhengia sp. TaxID=2944208 RepID=UPI0029091F26|nr:phage head closure protein [Clostridiales bacterium]MDU6974317.1 phage head closure protein [Clostridiales bacterium]
MIKYKVGDTIHFDAGKLNKRITFTAHTETTNSIGQTILFEQPIKTVWANIMPIRGFEQTLEERLRPETVYRILIRYHKGITPDMKIKYKDRILHITEIINVDEGDFALEITATSKEIRNGKE